MLCVRIVALVALAPCGALVLGPVACGALVLGPVARARAPLASRASSVRCGLFDFLQRPEIPPEENWKNFIPEDLPNPADFSVEELNALKAAR